MSGIEKIMEISGFIIITIGVIGGLILFTQVDYESYSFAKEVADSLRSNTLAQAEYQAAATLYVSQISLSIGTLIGGVVVGLFLLGFARLIRLTEDKKRLLEEIKINKV
ncbi:hypothetical protein ACWE42_24855 [Sutcliffiella cohnii]